MIRDHEEFLHKLIQLEGWCGITICVTCKKYPIIYQCHDCLTLNIYCKDCIVSRHTSQPLHYNKVSCLVIEYTKISQQTLRNDKACSELGPCSRSLVWSSSLDTTQASHIVCPSPPTPMTLLWFMVMESISWHSNSVGAKWQRVLSSNCFNLDCFLGVQTNHTQQPLSAFWRSAIFFLSSQRFQHIITTIHLLAVPIILAYLHQRYEWLALTIIVTIEIFRF